MIYLQLFLAFFKIGLFSFGGGYVMIPLIQSEVVSVNGWITAAQFADVVAISQMTPGPIAVNAATFIGANAAGPLGSFFATLGVSAPSFILIIIVAKMMQKFNDSVAIASLLKGIRPVTIGMIGSASLLFATMSFLSLNLNSEFKKLIAMRANEMFTDVSIIVMPFVIFIVILISTLKFKLNPIGAVVLSAVLGVLLIR